MVRHASLFSQLLDVFPRWEFERLVRDIGTERGSKGFSSWTHFVSLLFCQLAQASSLREISSGLATCLGKLSHLGLKAPPSKSTLSYANNKRSWLLFEALFYGLWGHLRVDPQIRRKLKLPGKLYSLDATVIPLCLSVFDWARYRSAKGAIKLHAVLDHDGYLPRFAVVTEARVHDLTPAYDFHFPPGSVVVVDRGYWAAGLFSQWQRDRVFFVTRQREGPQLAVIESHKGTGDVLADEFVEMTGDSRQRHPYVLRRVVYRAPDSGKVYRFMTNLFDAPAQVIADVYKERWQIETFFKALKQNLKIKTFIGTTPNAVLSQIWTALITLLLLRYLKLRSRRGWALSNLVALLRWNLFTYRDLWRWLDEPYKVPPAGPPPEQLSLGF